MVLSLESSAIYSESLPAVGRYKAIWMLTVQFGSSNMIGRKEEVSVIWMLIKGSRYFLHNIKVPPFALDDTRGISGLCRSSELSETQ